MLERQDESKLVVNTVFAHRDNMESWPWVATFIVIFVAVVLPYLKKMPDGSPRKKDVVFQVSGLLLLIAILVASVEPLYTPGSLFLSPMIVVGTTMFVIGLIITVRAQMTISTNYSWTLEIRDGHTLVESGLYKYVRHPIYTGTLIRLISIPVFTSSLPGFILSLLSIPVLNYRIGLEEGMLIEEFGEEYERYKERTWRLFPYIY
ncbi:isoprenylcysteine carboxylmethyltransferase family protein [Candidatus Bathyarchaeota archaeon]|nr:isoprenylcysteine carboxylmethyltransferase family protein [Candidatus Bathyarchaeota archaeon]MBT4424420.1 isoprenylcysteine carboxylmethyltransferase family protein [Candidatus Bathyarchaeota archaeon]MBT5642917.1 isoprenylcysteine carboxylmethyltransferase family protein [Candidatus Bathyarchaeota archaeon]MBT6604804.1 isoprenylcysteine carboxylmethyltransferase family protein [Candidatus Bathyarchaeota archaeon]MBT7187878.1 isoprenylcysteine carboxylmethyltransferase family protein [Cand